MKRVFISYARGDSDSARQLLDGLAEKNILGWIDQPDSAAGGYVGSQVRKALRRASAIVILISETALQSQWFQFEVGAAISMDKPIIPIFFGQPAIDAAPDFLKGIRYIDAGQRSMFDVAGDVVTALESSFEGLGEAHEKSDFKSLVVGICGGTGSGKTTVANRILTTINFEDVVFIQQDSYYRSLRDLPLDYRNLANFDHPDALDNDLLVYHLKKLRAGEPVELPLYDFKTHTRLSDTLSIEPEPIVIVEGILIFSDPRLLEQMDIKVFVDTPDDIRFIRRLRRDIAERARTVESVIEQYEATVRPMHMQFVEPSKRHADVIIPEGGHNLVSIDLLSGTIREKLASALTTVGGQA